MTTVVDKIACRSCTACKKKTKICVNPIWSCDFRYNLHGRRSSPRVVSYGTVASEAYHDWSGEAADAQLRVNFTLKLLLSQNFCNRPLMRFISFASNIGPAAAVPAGPAPAPLRQLANCRSCQPTSLTLEPTLGSCRMEVAR